MRRYDWTYAVFLLLVVDSVFANEASSSLFRGSRHMKQGPSTFLNPGAQDPCVFEALSDSDTPQQLPQRSALRMVPCRGD